MTHLNGDCCAESKWLNKVSTVFCVECFLENSGLDRPIDMVRINDGTTTSVCR